MPKMSKTLQWYEYSTVRAVNGVSSLLCYISKYILKVIADNVFRLQRAYEVILRSILAVRPRGNAAHNSAKCAMKAYSDTSIYYYFHKAYDLTNK